MTLQDFINKYTGVLCGNTPENQGQCVGLISLWMDNLGIAHEWGNAKDLLDNADTTKFDVIRNDPTNTNQFPLPGDIMVWDSSWGNGFGHTGVIVSANGTSFDCFEQNNPGAPQVNHHDNYNGVLGWLHPKAVPQPIDQATLDQLRADRDSNWNKFTEEVTLNGELTQKIADQQKELDNRQNAINTLNSKVSQLSTVLSQDALQDHDMGVKLLDLEHSFNSICDALGLPQNSTIDQITSSIASLKAPHDEVVKQVVPVMNKLAEAAIYKRVPKAQSFIDTLKKFFHMS